MYACILVFLSIAAPYLAQYADYGSAVWDSPNRQRYEEQTKKTLCDGLWIRPLNRTGSSPRHRCLCNATHISCINLQMTPPPPGATPAENEKETGAYFMELEEDKFSKIESITIHGNNLEQLPTQIFNPASTVHENLKTLNLSSNYFISMNSHAFNEDQHLSNLKVLDLSDNEIILNTKDIDIFKHLTGLRKLVLKRSFNGYRSKEIVPLLDAAFSRAGSRDLRELVLDHNFFHKVPRHIGCYFQKLEALSLRGNYIRSWDLASNRSCLQGLHLLDLSDQIGLLTPGIDFIRLIESLPEHTNIILENVRFNYSSELIHFIAWVNETTRPIALHRATVVYPRGSPGHFAYFTQARDMPVSALKYAMKHPPNGATRHDVIRVSLISVTVTLLMRSFTL